MVATKKKASPADYIPSATFPKKPRSGKDIVANTIDAIIASSKPDADGFPTKVGKSHALQGPHGIGKTSAAKAATAARGLDMVYLSAPVLDVTALYCSFPYRDPDGADADEVRTKIKTILARQFQNHTKPWLLVVDDFRRVQPSAQGAMFELMNEGTLSGRGLDNCVGCLLLDNPAGDGYMGVGGGDPAFESRFITVEVDTNGTRWREALAARYAETNLTDLFDAWSKWDPVVRRTINPRVLDHLIGVSLEGLPQEVGLPILPSGRQKVIDAGGTDVTEQVLTTVANALGVPHRTRLDGLVYKALDIATRNGWNVHIVGPHGVGKTAVVKSELARLGVDEAYLSMAHITPSDLLVTVPVGETGIEVIPNERLIAQPGQPKSIVTDEMFRSKANVKGQMLEMYLEGTLGGVDLGVKSIIALNNPAKWGDFTYPVGKADEALCSRFEINLFVGIDDIDWRSYLTSTYGEEIAHPFLEWRAHSLTDVEKCIVVPRVLDALIQTHLYNMDVKPAQRIPLNSAIPMGADGKRINVRMNDLERRLEGLLVLGFSRIVRESDDVLAKLTADTSDDEPADVERRALEREVTNALRNAELHELQAHMDLCASLISACDQHARVSILRSAKASSDATERQRFWSQVATKMRESRDA